MKDFIANAEKKLDAWGEKLEKKKAAKVEQDTPKTTS